MVNVLWTLTLDCYFCIDNCPISNYPLMDTIDNIDIVT